MIKLKAPKISKKQETAKVSDYDERPTISFSENELPGINKWTIDGKYKLEMSVQMTGIRKEEYGANKGKNSATFRITAVGVCKE